MKAWNIPRRIWIAVFIVAVAVTAAAGVLLFTDGTNAFKSYAGITCDGKRPERSPERAATLLVTSALKGDKAGVCRAVGAGPGQGSEWLNDEAMSSLREVFTQHGLTESNLRVVVPPEDQMGSHYSVQLYAGTSAAGPLHIGAMAHWDAGYTADFPEGVRGLPAPEDAEPPSESSSVDPSASATAG